MALLPTHLGVDVLAGRISSYPSVVLVSTLERLLTVLMWYSRAVDIGLLTQKPLKHNEKFPLSLARVRSPESVLGCSFECCPVQIPLLQRTRRSASV